MLDGEQWSVEYDDKMIDLDDFYQLHCAVPSTITASIVHRLTARCELMEIRSAQDVEADFFWKNLTPNFEIISKRSSRGPLAHNF